MRSYKHIQLDYLYLMAENDMSFAKDILYSFKETIPLYFRDLDAAIVNKSEDDIRFFAHKLSSSVQIVGAAGLSDIARFIENEVISKADFNQLQEANVNLSKAFDEVVKELNEELNHLHKLL